MDWPGQEAFSGCASAGLAHVMFVYAVRGWVASDGNIVALPGSKVTFEPSPFRLLVKEHLGIPMKLVVL